VEMDLLDLEGRAAALGYVAGAAYRPARPIW